MLPPITDAQRRLIFLALFSLLLALALVQHVGRMKGVGFTTHDDMALDLMAQEVKTDGLPAYFRRAQSIAAPQGRVSYYAGLVFFLIPYFVQSDIFRALLCAGIHLVSVAALAAYPAYYHVPMELTNRTGKPMIVWFGAEVGTGHPEESKLEISYEAKTESFDVNDKRQPISTELLVPAGVSRLSIKSYAQRVTAPGDARFLTFAIYNWRVVSLEAAPGDFECAG
jgi:hypothetical protein